MLPPVQVQLLEVPASQVQVGHFYPFLDGNYDVRALVRIDAAEEIDGWVYLDLLHHGRRIHRADRIIQIVQAVAGEPLPF